MRKTRIGAGAGLSLGAILALPAAAQADDFTVTNLNGSGSGSLREAVEDSNANDGADRILFQSKLSGTIQLVDDPINLLDSVDLIGPGARRVTVSGPDTGAVFSVYPSYASTIDAEISGLTLTGGNAGPGGGIGAFAGAPGRGVNLTISKATISGNRAGQTGGGIYMADVDEDLGSRITIADSTISGNTAELDGGGIFINGTVGGSIRNSTISGNSALSASGIHGGGGIWVHREPLRIESSTVAGNDAEFGGGIFTSGADVTLDGTVVADNTADDGADVFVDYGLYASFVGDYTLIEDDAGFPVGGSNNVFGVDPALQPLKNNGGPTDTHAFKKSPAKNAGPSDAPDKDQRGAPRKGKADIGAYEFTKCKGVIVNFVGTSGKDKLKGTKRKDGMLGLGGNDKLKGKKGKDGLCGGRGKDKLIGGPGKDKFNGGPGKDKEVQ